MTGQQGLATRPVAAQIGCGCGCALTTVVFSPPFRGGSQRKRQRLLGCHRTFKQMHTLTESCMVPRTELRHKEHSQNIAVEACLPLLAPG